MIFSKFICFPKPNRSIITVLRTYKKQPTYRPSIMPKDNKNYVAELQKQRMRIKAQAAKYAPSQISLQVMGNGSRAESRSVLLVTDHTNYIFNCGEGTQRLSCEHHAKLTKTEHIFLTMSTWENMGGIPGIALTIQDTGVPKINIHGPEGSIDIVEATSSFIMLNQLQVLPTDCSKQFKDHTMTVDYLSINNPNKSESDEVAGPLGMPFDNTNYYDYQINSNGKRSRPNSPIEKVAKAKLLDPKHRIDSMMIYICKLHPRIGALDINKCIEAGVKPGPNLGKLKAGEDITLPDGKVLKSKDVVSDPEPGPSFIVMECPNESWIDVIVENSVLEKYQEQNATNENNLVTYIVHFTPENILKNTKYKNWMRKFGTKTQHLIINESNTGYASEAMHKMQHQLHLIHPTIFPFFGNEQFFENQNLQQNVEKILEDKTTENVESSRSTEMEKASTKNDDLNTSLVQDDELKILHCKTLNEVQLRPHNGFQENCVKIQPKEYVQDVFSIDGFLDALADLQTEVNAKTKSLGNMEEYPKLIMLGTGSSIPNKVRNTSGILFQISKDNSILLDCGESTFGQMVRFFGESEVDRILKSIKAIYISHLHADHHLGFLRVLKQRKRVTNEPVFLLAPQQISSYLYFYHNRFESILHDFRLVSNRDLLLNQTILTESVSKDLYEAVDVANISTVFVTHCAFAYGVAITLKDGRKICYSGDTIPCENMIKLAQESFLLIHEATMEDGLENEAMMKRHSTISQAVNIGVKAQANFTLLTHFSQRYSKIPLLPNNSQNRVNFDTVGISYDFMSISLSQLKLLPLFYPALSVMFSEFRAMLDERASRREWRKENLLTSLSKV